MFIIPGPSNATVTSCQLCCPWDNQKCLANFQPSPGVFCCQNTGWPQTHLSSGKRPWRDQGSFLSSCSHGNENEDLFTNQCLIRSSRQFFSYLLDLHCTVIFFFFPPYLVYNSSTFQAPEPWGWVTNMWGLTLPMNNLHPRWEGPQEWWQ